MIKLEKFEKTPIRQLKVAELIKEIIAEIFSQKILNSKVVLDNFITVSNVKVSPDLHNATVYINVFQAKNLNNVLDELNALSPKLRNLLNKNIKLKFSPKLSFRYDDSIDEALRIENILDSIKNRE